MKNQPCHDPVKCGREQGFLATFRNSLMKTISGLFFVLALFIFPGSSCLAGEDATGIPSKNQAVALQNEPKQYEAISANYPVPDVVLIDSNGKPMRLAEFLTQPKPVLLQFIFTSCSTVCPLLSLTFLHAQQELERVKVDSQLISISIDPEYDTVDRLKAFAKRFHAGDNWLFLTGKKNDIRRVLSAFDALYQSDNKMYHRPLLYLHTAPNAPWMRFEGYIDAPELMIKIKTALALTKIYQ